MLNLIAQVFQRPKKSVIPQRGFTLIELIMAISILAIMMLLSFFCFDATVQSWRAGQEMSDSMAQVDYVMTQIESALRSAYYSPTVKKDDDKGFSLLKEGEGEDARDVLEWMKLGRAFVGKMKDVDGKSEIAEFPHRVRIYIDEENRDNKGGGLMARAWSTDFRDEDEFDVEEDVEPVQISPRVIGMECKVLKEPPPKSADGTIKETEWEDKWTSSNALPYKVSITLYMKPIEEGKDPVVISRDIEIPVWKYSQNPGTDSKKGKKPGNSDQLKPGQKPNRPGTGGSNSGAGHRPGGGFDSGFGGGGWPGGQNGGRPGGGMPGRPGGGGMPPGGRPMGPGPGGPGPR